MPLTSSQAEILRQIAANRSPESYVAGATVLHRDADSPRFSEDSVPKFDWVSEENTEVVSFQREYVWPRAKADRFIESLLLGLPVPSIFLVKEPSGRFLVLDGHQRLITLRSTTTAS